MQAHKPAASSHLLYDRKASRKPTRLSVNSDLLDKARELGVDLANTLEEALAVEVHKRQREVWLAENQEAIEAYNELVERTGVFSAGSEPRSPGSTGTVPRSSAPSISS
jgi:antitoxin CcdA